MKNSLSITTPTDREIVITRTFDAPRHLVWDAMSKPELLKRWLFAPPGWSMLVCDEDHRVGGAFRWEWSNPAGPTMAIQGLYREIVPPERIVRTEKFEFGCDTQAGEQLATIVLSEQGIKTLLTITVLYPSKEARDGTLASGMEKGMGAGYDRLDEIFASNAIPSNSADFYNREVVTTRVFDAPRDLVFRAWTEPEHLSRWWGPKGFTNTIQEFNPRPGGAFRLVMHGPNGADYPGEFVFVEISAPNRIVMDHITPPRFRLTVCFDELRGKTKISFRQLFESAEIFDKIKSLAMPGNEEMFEKLASELASMGNGSGHVLHTSRIVGAPRELVWQAWTDPRHLAKWWGPRGFTNPRCEVDLRVGGSLRIDMKGPDGTVYPMVGRFVEIVPPERLIFTSSPLDKDGKPIFDITNTIQFHVLGPITRLEVHTHVEKVHNPIGFGYLSGQEQGWSESLYRLADLLDAGT